jgi:hypothetical protein
MDAREPVQANNDGGIISSVSNALNKAVTSVIAAPTAFGTYENTNASINNARSAFSNMITINENIFYLIFIVFIIMLVIAYVIYYIISDNILYQQKIEVDGTNVPIICNELSEFKIDKAFTNQNGNGIKRSYGFWIYINDINKYSGKYRHIAHLSASSLTQQSGAIKDASPYIFLDSFKNEIHVRFSPLPDKDTTSTITSSKKLNDINNKDDLLKYGSEKKDCGITIKYVPIQRWVYIVIVVSDINGGIIYTYIDAEFANIAKVKTNDVNLDLTELNFEMNKGSLFVGGNMSDSISDTMGFSGLISKFSIYNYDLNKNDIYKEYNRGPFNGLLTSLGIGSYGLRNPVYKINNIY